MRNIQGYIWRGNNGTVTTNEVFFRTNETTVTHAGKNEEPQADTGKKNFSVSTGNCLSQSTKIVLNCKNI